ncbi:MAG: outer membrane beta-barrel protein [Tannerellaceae bacterium]|nr:outer membrane beta-barrel protein [Tannerellaceae bacterium]
MMTCLGLSAQRGNPTGRPVVEVKGFVLEEGTKSPVEQATIRLLNVTDSTLVHGVATARNGSFAIKDIAAGTYLLAVTFVGYEPYYQPLRITGRNNPVNVGEIELRDAAVALGEAVVIGKAAEVVVRNDTIEYNADSYKVTEGAVLEDLLKKMPGVEVSSEGTITVNGKQVKKIMVDGKEFFSDDPNVASKNLPADMINKLQVVDRKSDMTRMTGFDDGEEETIINLTVKPGMKQGWFGNAFAGYGSRERYEGNLMVNRFVDNDQVTLMGGLNNTNNMGFADLASTMFQGGGGGAGGFRFSGGNSGITASGNTGLNFGKEIGKTLMLNGNLRYSYSDNHATNKSFEQRLLRGDTTQYTDQEDVRNRINNNLGANLRMEWKPDTLTNLIFRPNFTYSESRSRESGDYLTLQGYDPAHTGSKDTLNVGDAQSSSEGVGYNLNATLEVSRKLNAKGRVVSASFSGGYNLSDEDGLNYSNTQYFGEENTYRNLLIDQQYQYKNTGYNYRVYVSLVEPLGRNNFLQATYRFSRQRQEALKYTYAPDASGAYNLLDTAYSKSYRNDFTTQRASLSFKAQRATYNYTLGLNLDPSYSQSRNFVGEEVFSELSRSVLNFSPMAQFNYLFNRQTNLRVDYNGRTREPSMTQLQPVADVSNPNNTVIGNPNLSPRYVNDLSVRFQRFLPEQQTAFMLMFNGDYTLNDIVSDVTNISAGIRRTTYANVDGNYSANLRFMMNTPLRNKKFTVNSMTMASYNNSNALVDGEKSANQNLVLMETAGLNYRSDLIDLGLNGNIRYNNSQYSLQPDNNQNTFNYGFGGTTILYLPLAFKLESDITYSTNAGYSSGFQQKELMWNASASKSFLKGNQGTLRLKIYDLLQQRSNISRSVTATGYTDSEYNTLNSYFMVHFIYRFSIFKGGASRSDAPRGPAPGAPGGPPPGGGGRRFGG